MKEGAADETKNEILWDFIFKLGLELCYLRLDRELRSHLCIF